MVARRLLFKRHREEEATMLFDNRPRAAVRQRPPIDLEPHDRVETATFAVG
jgi:hypothetical protein